MARPKYCRHIAGMPDKNYFKPKGIPSSLLEEKVLTLDEFEAIRLADLEGLYQEQAAAEMGISRQTFGRIIESAHKKIADVLINGKALKIEGGEVSVSEIKQCICEKCRKIFNTDQNTPNMTICPHCKKRA
jgi:uncharacterized protein